MKRTNLLVCATMLLIAVSLLGACAFNNVRKDAKTQFIGDFELDVDKDSLRFEELFNNYEGFPYEGIALYKITLDSEARKELSKWNSFPISEDAELFLESVSNYVELPEIADGYWMFINRNPKSQKYTAVSMCVYDAVGEVAYLITMDS